MRRFDALRAVSGVSEFSGLIFDILKDKTTLDELTKFLAEDLSEKQRQILLSVAESGNYPLSMDGLRQ